MNRLLSFTWKLLVVLLLGCGTAESESEDSGFWNAEDALSTLTPVQTAFLPGALVRSNGAQELPDAALGATYSSTLGPRYVFAWRAFNSPFYVSYLLVDGKPGSPTYGQLVVPPTLTTCAGGTPCTQMNLADGATLRESSNVDHAWIVYQRGGWIFGGGLGSTASRMGALRFNAAGAHSEFVLRDCTNPESGGLDCVLHLPQADSSTRGTGDKMLVSYFVATAVATNNWQVGSMLVSPSGAVVNLSPVDSCGAPPCPLSGSDHHIATAYNALEDKFLTVWVEMNPAFQKRLRAQVYNGTTGALVGGTLNLTSGLPATFTSNSLGATSHPVTAHTA